MTIYNNVSAREFPLATSKLRSLLFITVLSLSACSKNNEENTINTTFYQSASTKTISPQQGYAVTRYYLGQFKAKQQTNLSFEYAGKVNQLLVDNGDVVIKNQLLAKQDTQLLQYKTTELQAQIDQAKAQVSLNQANLNRIKTLIDDGYSSQQRLDELNAENQILHAKINGLLAQIKTLHYQKEKAGLLAPFNGVITKRLISTGEVLAPSIPVFQLIEQNNNEVNVGIPATLAMKLSVGDIFDLEVVNDSKTKQKARLISIGKQIDPLSRTVQLRLTVIDKKKPNLQLNGQLVRIEITEQINKPGFWLPLAAITDAARGQWQIYIAKANTDEKNRFSLQPTTVNILHTEQHSVYITGLALKPHKIISQGVHRYVGGQIIQASNYTIATTVKGEP